MRAIQHHYINRDFFNLMEISAFAVIIGLATSLASFHFLQLYQVSISTAALSISGPLKSEIYGFYIKNGYWPNTQDFKQLGEYMGDENTVTEIIIEKGSFHIRINKKFGILGDKVLSFRKAQFNNILDTPIWWICGYSEIPEGMETNVENKTNIDKTYLQRTCL